MRRLLRVERSASEYTASSKCLCWIDPDALARLALSPGQVIRVESLRGRGVLARIAPPRAEDKGTGSIRLDRFLRQAIKARLREPVRVEPVEVGPIKQLRLRPAVDIFSAHRLEDHLRDTMATNQTPLMVGSVVYINFHGSVAGTTYKAIDLDAPGIVDPQTRITIEFGDTIHTDATTDVTFDDVGGLTPQVDLIRELVQLPLQFPQVYRQLGINPPRGILLYGPPGVGKTHLARAIANEIDARFYYINGPDIIGTLYGETEGNLRRMFDEATHHGPSIILVDEIDALVPKRGETGAHSDTRIVTQFLSLLDGLTRVDGVLVIGTTNRIEAIDVALRRPGRFDREIFVGPPNAEGRLQVLEIHTREMPLAHETHDHLAHVARVTPGFVGADLMELCREAGLNALRRHHRRPAHLEWRPEEQSDDEEPHWHSHGDGELHWHSHGDGEAHEHTRGDGEAREHVHLDAPGMSFQTEQSWETVLNIPPELLQVLPEDFEVALRRIRPSASREVMVTVPKVTWEDVGGLRVIKERISRLIEFTLTHRDLLTEQQIRPATGILLYGPPGTGKTLLAQAIANQCGVNFVPVDGPEIFTKWLGASEEAIRHVFRVALQLSPAIIFFDQLDALAPKRGEDSGSRTTERVVNQLLSELDGIEPLSGIVVMAATNRVDLIDPSVLRPGRFGTHVFVPLPDAGGRREILQIHLRGAAIAPGTDSKDIVDFLVPRTEGWSGADVKALCDLAKQHSLWQTNGAESSTLGLGHFVKAYEECASQLLQTQLSEDGTGAAAPPLSRSS